MKTRLLLLSCAIAFLGVPRAHAQLAAPGEGGVAMGHVHLTAKDVEASRRFFTALGGTPVQNGHAADDSVSGRVHPDAPGRRDRRHRRIRGQPLRIQRQGSQGIGRKMAGVRADGRGHSRRPGMADDS